MSTLTQHDYTVLADRARLERTKQALSANGFLPEVVSGKSEALARIKELIPKGASVMNGASRTLEEIGFTELLKSGSHEWNNLHQAIIAETDNQEQAKLRKESVLSDVYLGSVHALAETGELLIASNSGSQLPHLVFTSHTVILVVGAQKVVPDLARAFDRLHTHVVPLEDTRALGAYGVHTMHAKSVILHKENAMMSRKVHILIVNEALGF